MQRKFFDVFASAIGLVMVVALVVAGSLLMWGYSFANSNVHNQLAAQDITFPTAAEFAHAKPGTEITPQMLPYLLQYAGQPLTTGAQAEAYANHFIAYHLAEMPYNGVYATVSAESRANPTNAKLAAEVQHGLHGHHAAGTAARGLRLQRDRAPSPSGPGSRRSSLPASCWSWLPSASGTPAGSVRTRSSWSTTTTSW